MIETKDGTYAIDLIDCCTYDLCEEDNYCEGKVKTISSGNVAVPPNLPLATIAYRLIG